MWKISMTTQLNIHTGIALSMSWKIKHQNWDNCYFCGLERNGKNLEIWGGKDPRGMLILCCDDCKFYLDEFFMKIYPPTLPQE